MKGILYIPYANSSCVRGFTYDKPLSSEQYVKMETKEYNDHKNGVDTMMLTRYGNNMSYNSYNKRKFNYKKQNYEYIECDCVVLNDDGKSQSVSELINYEKEQEPFVLILNLILKKSDNKLYNENELKKISDNADIETEIKRWISDSTKVKNCKRLSDVEVMYHLPKKDFKLKLDNKVFILKDCKFLKIMSSVSYNVFAMMVSKITMVKE